MSAPPGWGGWALLSFTEAPFHVLHATSVPEGVPRSWNSGGRLGQVQTEKEPVEQAWLT